MTQEAQSVGHAVGAGDEQFERARARLDEIRRVDHPGVAAPTRVLLARDGQVMVDEPLAGAPTLADVLGARGTLTAGECVWLGMQAAGVLADLHRAGVAHGALDARALRVPGAAVVVVRMVDGLGEGSAPDDVRALGEILARAVRPADEDRVRAWTAPMTHPDPQARPTAAMVARALRSCAEPEPIDVPVSSVAGKVRAAARASGPEPLPHTRWWRAWTAVRDRARWAVPVLAAAIVVGGVAVVVWPSDADAGHAAQSDHLAVQQATSAAAEQPDLSAADVAAAVDAAAPWEGTDPAQAGLELTQRRLDAVVASDAAALRATVARGSAAAAEAEVTAAALEAGTFGVDGLEARVTRAQTVESGATPTVSVTYELSAHTVTTDGVPQRQAGYAQTVLLSLVWEDEGWRVAEVRVVDDGPEPPADNVTGRDLA